MRRPGGADRGTSPARPATAAEGDAERAAVEFRNILRLDPEHAAARLAFARLLRAQGETATALGNYTLLVDQDRDSLEGYRELAELALAPQDFEAAGLSVARTFALAPRDPAVRALKATLDYRTGDQARSLAAARGVIADAPDSVPAQMVLIAKHMNAEDLAGALARIDAALPMRSRTRGCISSASPHSRISAMQGRRRPARAHGRALSGERWREPGAGARATSRAPRRRCAASPPATRRHPSPCSPWFGSSTRLRAPRPGVPRSTG